MNTKITEASYVIDYLSNKKNIIHSLRFSMAEILHYIFTCYAYVVTRGHVAHSSGPPAEPTSPPTSNAPCVT